MKKTKLVYVTWNDATGHTQGSWDSVRDVEEWKPMVVHSIGWIIADTDTHITIAGTYTDDKKDCSAAHCIPKAMIIKKRFITLPDR